MVLALILVFGSLLSFLLMAIHFAYFDLGTLTVPAGTAVYEMLGLFHPALRVRGEDKKGLGNDCISSPNLPGTFREFN